MKSKQTKKKRALKVASPPAAKKKRAAKVTTPAAAKKNRAGKVAGSVAAKKKRAAKAASPAAAKKKRTVKVAGVAAAKKQAGAGERTQPVGLSRGRIASRRRMGAEDENIYHVTSRTVGGEVNFNDEEKDAFRVLMRRMEKFAGIEILTYAVTGEKFDFLVRVPERSKFVRQFEGADGDEVLLEHMNLLYTRESLDAYKRHLGRLRKEGNEERVRELLDKYTDWMCQLAPFMKEFKVRFSRWYNSHRGRRGIVWMTRYDSLIIGDGKALRTVAVYVDGIPLRAGLCEDPKDYRWCGYAEAASGSKRARRGLCRALGRPRDSWLEKPKKGGLKAADSYRKLLLSEGRVMGDITSLVQRRKWSRNKKRTPATLVVKPLVIRDYSDEE